MSAVAIVRDMATVSAAAFCSQGRDPIPTEEGVPPFAPPIMPLPTENGDGPELKLFIKVRGDMTNMITRTHANTVAAATT